MNNKYHHYKITLEHIHSPKGDNLHTPVEVIVDNHDNIFAIIEKLKERNLFNDDNQSAKFAIGLKLFSEVMLRNKENLLFKDLLPAFNEFMQKLKSGS